MTATEEVKARKKAAKAPQRKQALETLKTMAIVALVTGLICFIAGMHYQGNINTDKQNAVANAVRTARTLKH